MDILIFAAHPDDAELAMGGTIAKLTSAQFKVGIIDFTYGEMGTRGSKSIRKKEANEASKILNIDYRKNLAFPDGKLSVDEKHISKAVQLIRLHKPKIIFAPFSNDRHPDHMALSNIIKSAYFYAGVAKYKTTFNKKPQLQYRPINLFYFMQAYEFEPSFIIDVSNYHKTKMEAVNAYGSQFYNPASAEPKTLISSKRFLDYLEARAKVFGFKVGCEYGEAFFTEEKVAFNINSYLKDLGEK